MSMVANLFYAEWQKITGNRIAIAFFVWMFPLMTFIAASIAIVIALLSEDFREVQRIQGIYGWDESLLYTWGLVNNIVGRWITLAFTAFVFAGEYSNGTWKNLTTRRSRVALILNKFVVVSVLVLMSYTLMSLINMIGSGILANVVGLDYGFSEFGARFNDFIGEYLLQIFLTMTGTFIIAAFAALAAMVAKNVLAAVGFAVGINIFELLGVIFVMGLINWALQIDLSPLYRYLPSYNLENVAQWIRVNQGTPPFTLAEVAPEPNTMAVSLVLVAVWVVGLVGLTAYLFKRQDITM